jgi:hypothetical protein
MTITDMVNTIKSNLNILIMNKVLIIKHYKQIHIPI